MNMDISLHKSNTDQIINRPTQRLKDSCDMCSASKVRCKREKPVCDRCAKLGYPCFYSPARRVGRPHRRRATSSTSQPIISTQSESYSSKPDDRMICSQADCFQSRTALSHDFNVSGSADNHKSSSNAGSNPNMQVGSVPAGSCDYLNFSGINSGPNSASSTDEPQNSFPISESRVRSISNATAGAPNGCESDCAGIAMGLQQQLEAAYETPALLSMREGGQMEEKGTDAAMETAGSALRQLSTMLICPCSERLEVGLLVAAACNSILDVYNVIIRSSAAQPLSLSDMSAWTMTMVDDVLDCNMISLPESSSGTLCFDDFEEDILLVRVMGELAKMATVIIQFTKRYKARCSGNADSSDLLYAVATYLRKRLQTIKDETTGRL